jgi:allophanate hydrolase subunit 2
VGHVSADSFQFSRDGVVVGLAGAAVGAGVSRREVVTVPILSLRPGESLRLKGADKGHVARLAETESPLPPILVDRRSMRVIDGTHRLLAASLRGREMVDVASGA